MLEGTDQRIAELRKEAYEFKRDIVVGAENFRTGKTMAEKVIRYMEEKLRHKVLSCLRRIDNLHKHCVQSHTHLRKGLSFPSIIALRTYSRFSFLAFSQSLCAGHVH